MEKLELIEKAKEARKLSYSPYSNFAVGAALLTKDGQVFLGTNIENSSYPLCMCAERNALYNAYMHGYKKEDFVALALSADTDEPCSPCGACRQVMLESQFRAGDKVEVLLCSSKDIYIADSVDALLPFGFDYNDLK